MTEKYLKTRILQKVDTSTNWTKNNPTLGKGEIGYESDTYKFKIGDGSSKWSSLSYTNSAMLGGHAPEYFLNTSQGYATQSWVQNSAKAHAATNADYASYAGNIRFPTSMSGGVPVPSQSFWPSTRANRLSFLPAFNILVEESIDAGKTWKDKVISDSTKTGLFSQTRPGITLPLKNGKKSCDCMLRITITAMHFKNVPENGTCAQKFAAWTVENATSTERYCSLDGIFLWLSSNSDRIHCLVERATGTLPNSWTKDGEGFCTGWSGADFIKLSGGVFGGGKTQTGNYWFRRFTFRTASTKNTFNDSDLSKGDYTASVQSVSEITAFGPNVWTYSNNLMNTDRLYRWDTNQNAIFPADVLASNISLKTHTHTFSGSQTLNWSCTPTGSITINSYKPEGTITNPGSQTALIGIKTTYSGDNNLQDTDKRLTITFNTANVMKSGTSTFTGTEKAPIGTFKGTTHNHTATVKISGTTGAAK